MQSLITDRERDNVLRRNELAQKGWLNMTASEKAEWLGDPLAATAVNLLPPGPYYSSAVELKYTSDSIVATTNAAGIYLYAISIIGEAAKYAGKTYTLSADYMTSTDGGTPQIALYWHDDNGFEYAGASLTQAGSVTFTLTENTANRAFLALYVYVTTDATVEAGAKARFSHVMFEPGSERHKHVPYADILTTRTTKGAYNYSDLNRVERVVAEISDIAGLNLTTKTDWAMWDVPTVADMERYLNNIKVIRAAFSGNEYSLPDNMNELTYSSANNIEKVLLNALWVLQTAPRSGELLCGEV